MPIKELFSHNSIELFEGDYASLNNFYDNIVEGKSFHRWLRGLKKSTAAYHIIEYDDDYRVHMWDLCRIIQNSGTTKIKKFYSDNKEVIDSNSMDRTRSIADAYDNIFIFEGTRIPTLVSEDVYYFHVDTLKTFMSREVNMNLYDTIMIDSNEFISHPDCDSFLINGGALIDLWKWFDESVIPHIEDELAYHDNTSDLSENNDINLDDYEDYYCVYFFKVRHNTYKYGDTYIIKNRMRSHMQQFDRIEYVKIYKFEDFRQMKEMADRFKQWTKQKRINYRDSQDRTEMFKTNKKMTIKHVMSMADSMYEIINVPPTGLKESKILFKLVEKLIFNYGYAETLEIIDDEFDENERNYIKKKILQQNEDVDLFAEKYKSYQDTKKQSKFCVKCDCKGCKKYKREATKNNQFCINCSCETCQNIKKTRYRYSTCKDCECDIYDRNERCFTCYNVSRRKVEWPSYDILKKELQTKTKTEVARKYDVAIQTITKWIKHYEKEAKVIVQPKPITNKCKQCQIPITHSATKCPTCYQKSTRKTTRPPYTQLMQEIADTSYKAVGKKYGVSDNAVRKWVNTYIKSDPIFQNRKKIDGHYRCEEEGCTNKTTNISLYCLPCMIANRGKNYFHTQKCDICNCFAKTNPCNECRNNSEELIDVPARPTKIRVKKETD